MVAFLVTGNPGSGKTTLAAELARRRLLAIDPDHGGATPHSIVGHYQCSSELSVGFGSQWCQGTESLLVLNDDGTYSLGDEAGTYTFDPDSFAMSFSGPLGTGSILNRKLATDGSVNGVEVRYTLIRLNY